MRARAAEFLRDSERCDAASAVARRYESIPPPERGAAAAARHGNAWGRPVADQEQLQALHAQGARLLAYGGEFQAILNLLRERGEEFDQLLQATEQEGG